LNLNQDYIKLMLFKYVENYQILHNEKSKSYFRWVIENMVFD